MSKGGDGSGGGGGAGGSDDDDDPTDPRGPGGSCARTFRRRMQPPDQNWPTTEQVAEILKRALADTYAADGIDNWQFDAVTVSLFARWAVGRQRRFQLGGGDPRHRRPARRRHELARVDGRVGRRRSLRGGPRNRAAWY